MAIADRDFNRRFTTGTTVSPLVIIIGINMGLFVLLSFFRAMAMVRAHEDEGLAAAFNNSVLSWSALSPVFKTALWRPWTFITHAFTHVSVWPLLANMVWLWVLGGVLLDITGNRKLAPVYIYGAISAGIFFILASWLLPGATEGIFLLGATSGILAICGALLALAPRYRLLTAIMGGVPLWVFALVFIALSVAQAVVFTPVIIAYASAIASGYGYILLIKNGYDAAGWMNSFFDKIQYGITSRNKPKADIKSTLFYNTGTAPFKKTSHFSPSRVDEILDKINRDGLASLTQEEKDLLQRASRESY